MPVFICPNCKQRSVDNDGFEGFSAQAVSCRSCGFGFLFELMDDYYPAPTAGLVACAAEGRVLAAGRGVFELTGSRDQDLLGRDLGAHLDDLRAGDWSALAGEPALRRPTPPPAAAR